MSIILPLQKETR